MTTGAAAGTAAATGASGLPEAVARRLEELRRSLVEALGARLAAIVVHGSAVRGGYDARRSDVDVILVLTDTSLETLEALSNALALARNAGRVEAMIMKESEIPRAADVFPLFYDDIRECHAVLSGKDPFEGLEVSDRHRRLRVEQELREAKIRLRRAIADGLGSDAALAGALERKVRQVRGPLRALLALLGEKVGPGLPEVVAASGRRWGLDTAPLLAVRRDPRGAHAVFRLLLDAALEDVDRLPDGGTP